MPTTTNLQITNRPDLAEAIGTTVVIGRKHHLDDAIREWAGVDADAWAAMLARTDAADGGASCSTWVGKRKVVVGVLPELCSRHNSPVRSWALPALARQASGKSDALILVILDDAAHGRGAAGAVARAFPLYSAASSRKRERTVQLALRGPEGDIDDPDLQAHIDGVRLAGRLVDTPTAQLHTDAFVAEAESLAADLGVGIEVIRGDDLKLRGFGGLWGVGKAASHPPAIVILRYQPEGTARSVAWVGKGIVYDTGGLSLKPKTSMVGMKGDMGGAAAVLGAFATAVRTGVPYGVTAVLCLAENAIGPDALRPDDIIVLKSGKSVEINNTDAEGRLVLGDGVAWAAEEADADLIVDIATLTGAALVATGKQHGALYCNNADIEAAAVECGLVTGEPCFPLPYAPELYRKEYKSKVADMRNSVKDRANAQASCAGQFVANHLPDPQPRWLHIDIAGPAWDSDNRGTGYGVGLLVALGPGPE